MRKVFLVAAILAGSFMAFQQANADDSASVQQQIPTGQAQVTASTVQSPDWDCFQLGFWFGIPSQTENTDVYGIKVGAPACGGKGTVNGIETSVFASGTDTVKGISSSILVATSKKVEGFQGSIVNYSEKVDGVQLGIVNIAKDGAFQIGLVNYIKDSPIPVLPIVNVYFK